MSLWDDERVALRYGKSVEKCHGEFALHSDAVPLNATEWAVVLVHKMNRFRQVKVDASLQRVLPILPKDGLRHAIGRSSLVGQTQRE